MAFNIGRDEEEQIFKKRLLYDGHGSGEDKRLMTIIKNITKFCVVEDSSVDDLTKLYNSISKDLAAGINAAERNEKISQMCDRMFAGLEQAIEDKAREIERFKSKLVRLELGLEYMEKRKKVDAYPDCRTTEEAMQEVERKKQHLVDTIMNQKNCLKLLADACDKLQQVLSSSSSPDSREMESLTPIENIS